MARQTFRKWRLVVAAVGLLLTVLGPAWAQRAKPAPRDLTRLLASPAQMDFMETPLSAVVEYLKDRHHIEIQLDRRALAEVGVREDSPVSVQSKNLSLASALLVTLHPMDLVCVTQPGFLLITTRAGAKRWGGQVPGLSSPKASPAEKGEAAEKTLAALRAPTRMEFIETPLTDVVDFLCDMHKIAIFLDKRALDAVGIKPNTPVTRKLTDVPLQGALLLMLDQLGLTCTRQEEFLIITTPREAKFWGGALKPLKDPADPVGKKSAEKIHAALQAPARMEFLQTPLSDVVEFLSDHHKIPIVSSRP